MSLVIHTTFPALQCGLVGGTAKKKREWPRHCIGPFAILVEAAGIEPASWSSEGTASTRVSQGLGLASGRSPEPDRPVASPLAFPAAVPGQAVSK